MDRQYFYILCRDETEVKDLPEKVFVNCLEFFVSEGYEAKFPIMPAPLCKYGEPLPFVNILKIDSMRGRKA